MPGGVGRKGGRQTSVLRGRHLKAGFAHAQRIEQALAQGLAEGHAVDHLDDHAEDIRGVSVSKPGSGLRHKRQGREITDEGVGVDAGHAGDEGRLRRPFAQISFRDLPVIGQPRRMAHEIAHRRRAIRARTRIHANGRELRKILGNRCIQHQRAFVHLNQGGKGDYRFGQ